MKKLIPIVVFLLLGGCAGMGGYDATKTESQTGLDDYVTGDTVTAAGLNAIKNTADAADALATVNEAAISGLKDGTVAMTTPAIGTPASGVATNLTGLPTAGLVDNAVTNEKLDDDDDFTVTGAWDFGGATSVEIPNGTDPDVDATGEISHDTDGANITDDSYYRGNHNNATQYPIGRRIVELWFPFTTSGAVTNWQPWFNQTGMAFTWVQIICRSDTDDLGIDIDESTSYSNLTIVNNIIDVTVSTDGTNVYYDVTEDDDGDVTDTIIDAGHGVSFDIDAAAEGFICIKGWFNANVN